MFIKLSPHYLWICNLMCKITDNRSVITAADMLWCGYMSKTTVDALH